MTDGAIEVDAIEPIGFPDITPELARESGFLGVLGLLKVAKHGKGENIYLLRFHYVRPRGKRKRAAKVRLGSKLALQMAKHRCRWGKRQRIHRLLTAQ